MSNDDTIEGHLVVEAPLALPKHVVCGITLARTSAGVPISLSITPAYPRSHVSIARSRFAEHCGVAETSLCYCSQVHGDFIVNADASAGHNEADGIWSAGGDKILCVSVADCCPVILVHPRLPLFAAVHSGWRGTQANIVGKAINRLARRCDVSELFAWIGPCASAQSYVVQSDVAQLFGEYAKPVPEGFLLDIKAAIMGQLLSMGLDPANIEMSAACTIQDSRYHSYRRDGTRSGRMTAFVGLKP